MLQINKKLSVQDLAVKLNRFWALSGEKILRINNEYDDSQGSPVMTINGKYSCRGWTEWTRGFQFGSTILQYDACAEPAFLEIGQRNTVEKMATHLTHTGVHDHGFNTISTYGNLLRLMGEGTIEKNQWQAEFYKLALMVSGAVQASRWTSLPNGGFMHSFNGSHSLFVDTIRSCRILLVADLFGHVLYGENDERISLFERAVQHVHATLRYSVYYGENRDQYDLPGRVAHESIFNIKNGIYRCPNSQQGYSPFSTWTRGLAWAIVGCAELYEYFQFRQNDLKNVQPILSELLRAFQVTFEFYKKYSPTDGIPYWDTGAPGLANMPAWADNPADPFNENEPVDSSAAAIAAQGFLRMGHALGIEANGCDYWQAGLTVLDRLLAEPYLSTSPDHQGLLLHTIYHYPNNWDYIPVGAKIPFGEACMWGDYHVREAALLVNNMLQGKPFYTFFDCARADLF